MATIKLSAGAVGSWTSIMGAELNLLTSGNAVFGTTTIDNSSNLDLEAEFSFVSGGAVVAAGAPVMGVYIYPQNGDGTSYGDRRFQAAQAVGPPPGSYAAGQFGVGTGTSVVSGVFAQYPGSFRVPLPRGVFLPGVYSNLGVTLSTSGNQLFWRTTNRSVA